MSQIDISIIIPVYGVEKYINRFMGSIVSQTIQNFRVIFIDDKTKDNSIEIISNYNTFFGDRIVVIRNEKNMGLSAARNVGIEYVYQNPTQYITFLDPDDWIEPEYLEDLFEKAQKYDLDLCISGISRDDEDNGAIICKELISMPEAVYEPINCDELAYINPCSYAKLFRFEPIKELRYKAIKRSEDTCYLFEALKKYKKIKFTNNAYYHYCVRQSSLTGGIDREKYDSMHEEFAKLLPEFRNIGSLEEKFVTQIYIRSSLGGVCRICFKNMRNAKSMEKIEYGFLNEFILSWRTNRYLCFFKKGIGGKKEFALRLSVLLYKMHLFIVFIWVYYFFVNILKKDVRA